MSESNKMLRKIIVGAIAVTGLAGVFSTSAKAATVTNIVKSREEVPYLIVGETIDDQGYTITYGQDSSPYGQYGLPLSYPTPVADKTASDFLANLSNPATQNFNGFPPGTVTSLPLDFGSAGTGTFQGQGTILAPNGSLFPQNDSNQLFAFGNRSAPVNEPGSTFNEIDFSKPVGAIGFSLSSPRGNPVSSTNLELTELDGTTKMIGFPVGGQSGQTTISYVDLVAQSLSEQFTKIRFIGDSSHIQSFGLENVTAASFDQIKKPTPVPEPTTMLGSLGAIAFGVVLRRKFKK